jgi:uncharacterized coiled-coil DUF342 family protein
MVENVKVTLENLDNEIINIDFEIEKLRLEKKKINGSKKIIKYTQNMMFIDELMDKIKKVDDQISYKIKYIYGDDLQECKRIINSLKSEYSDIVDEFDIDYDYDCDLLANSKQAEFFDDLFDKFEDIMSNKKEYGEALRGYDLEQRKKEWLENHDKLQEKHNKILNSFNRDNLINEVFETPVDCVNKDVDDEIPKKKVKMPRVRCGSCQDDVEFYGAEDNSDIDEDCKRCNDN